MTNAVVSSLVRLMSKDVVQPLVLGCTGGLTGCPGFWVLLTFSDRVFGSPLPGKTVVCSCYRSGFALMR